MFRFEAEMASPVARWMEQANLLTKAEFATPFGICDFVGVTLGRSGLPNVCALGKLAHLLR